MPYYKLTNQKLQTHNGFRWKAGEWVKTDGTGNLCSEGWLHCYNHPLLAVLLNPIHANVKNPKLFRVNVKGKKKTDKGLKFGFTNMRLIKELPLPRLTLNQRIAFAVLCAKQVYKDKDWIQWADNWLNGIGRSGNAAVHAAACAAACAAAAAADAAYAAAAAADAAYAADAAADAAYAAYAACAADAAADAAACAAAACAAAANIDLIKIAKQALKYK